ncbi:MAG: TIGR04211 family SH3 domain-containing protein [Chromatiaceae bacterium]
MKNRIPVFLLSLLFLVAPVHADIAYVTDEFRITLRSGESATHRILRMLPTGQRLEVLSRNAETGYTRVRTPGGQEGFVLSRQLVNQPVARDRLAAAEAEVAALKAAPGELRSRLASLTEEHRKLQQDHATLQSAKTQVDQEFAALQRTASNSVRIANERNDLRAQVTSLTREVEDIKQLNRELENKTAQNWFLIGAGVVVGGIILGLILPHLRVRRRKSDWGSL